MLFLRPSPEGREPGLWPVQKSTSPWLSPKAKYPFSPPLAAGTSGTYATPNQPHPGGAHLQHGDLSPQLRPDRGVNFLLLVHSHASRRRRQYGDTLASGPPSLVHGPGTPTPEMKTVVIRGAQARQNDGAFRIPSGQRFTPQKGGRSVPPLHENALDSVSAFPAHVPGIRGKIGRILPTGQRASSQFSGGGRKDR